LWEWLLNVLGVGLGLGLEHKSLKTSLALAAKETEDRTWLSLEKERGSSACELEPEVVVVE